jgi:hypothetical protein
LDERDATRVTDGAVLFRVFLILAGVAALVTATAVAVRRVMVPWLQVLLDDPRRRRPSELPAT